MQENLWAEGLNVAITISDTEGRIIYMNNKSAATFSKYGGKELIGSNLSSCHKPESWDKILKMMQSDKTNAYTIEKEGIKKLIYQTPWYSGGKPSGLVEFSLEIPFEMEHFIRK
jgi:hypothetical protein